MKYLYLVAIVIGTDTNASPTLVTKLTVVKCESKSIRIVPNSMVAGSTLCPFISRSDIGRVVIETEDYIRAFATAGQLATVKKQVLVHALLLINARIKMLEASRTILSKKHVLWNVTP